MTTYLVVFMWFNAWLYQTSHRLSNQYPTYVAALDAAIDTMTKSDKLLVVATWPALFITVTLATIALTVDSRLLAARMTPQDKEGAPSPDSMRTDKSELTQ